MKITIEVSEDMASLPQDKYQKIKRVAAVLRDADFEVEIIWHESVLGRKDFPIKQKEE